MKNKIISPHFLKMLIEKRGSLSYSKDIRKHTAHINFLCLLGKFATESIPGMKKKLIRAKGEGFSGIQKMRHMLAMQKKRKADT